MIIIHGFWFLDEMGDSHSLRMGTEEKYRDRVRSPVHPAQAMVRSPGCGRQGCRSLVWSYKHCPGKEGKQYGWAVFV